jgi:hypothetical protein
MAGRGIFCAVAMAAALMFMPSLARAQFEHQDDPLLLAVGAGSWDFDHHPEGELRGELRFPESVWMIKPLVGVIGSSRGSSYVYFGLRIDFIFADHYVVMPDAAVGWYHRGTDKNLGSPVEFKTGAEFAYRFDNAARIGIAFDHISNAGLTQANPGTEQLMLMVSYPF